MKKVVVMLLVCAVLMCLSACGGKVGNVQILEYDSEIYSDDDIEAAIDEAISYFRKEFYGCTLTEITYAGDDQLGSYQVFAMRNHADEVIVLVSSFDVDASGGDGSLNPNSTYRNWKWILVRNNGTDWQHVDHGY